MSHMSELAAEQEQDNLSGSDDMEQYIEWAKKYDEETLLKREEEKNDRKS